MAVKTVRVYGLSEVLLPVASAPDRPPVADEDTLASELAALGYPGLSHLESGRQKKNPAELLLSALGSDNLDSRLVEALPWIVLQFPDMNWRWLTQAAKAHDLQKRLGYVTNMERRMVVAGIRVFFKTCRLRFLDVPNDVPKHLRPPR